MLWIAVIILIFFIIYPYAVYPLILKFLPKQNTSYEKIEMDSVGKISVTLFIAAFNEEKVIAAKLENSLKLNFSGMDYEIVVGSDGSTDATNQIVRQYEKIHSNIKLLDFKERQGKVNVLNRGIPLCKGDIILLSDANAMYNSECLQYIVPHFQDPSVGCVAGEKRMLQTGEMISKNEGLYWKLESKIKQWESQVKTVIGADGACYAIRRSLFINLPSNTAVDDFLLSMKIVEQGYRIAYEPKAFSIEEAGSSMQQEWSRKTRIAAGNYFNIQFLTKFFQPSLVSFMFFSHKFLRWISPFLFILLTGTLCVLSYNSLIARLMYVLLLISYLVAFLEYKQYQLGILQYKFFHIITYFYVTVAAQFVGFLKEIKGTQMAIWDTIRN